MGGLFSKSSTSNEASTRGSLTKGNNSFRRSLRLKRRSTNESDSSTPQARIYATTGAKPAPRTRPGLPEEFQQQSGSVSTPTPSEVPPKTASTPYSPNVIAPKTSESVSKTPAAAQQEEADKVMDVLKSAITAKGKEAEGEVDRTIEKVGEKLQQRLTEGLQQVDALKAAAVGKGEEVHEEVSQKLEDVSMKSQQKIDKGLHHVEDILSQLAPADLSGEQSPEVETAPIPPASSLLVALEKRKAKKDVKEKEEHEKKGISPSPGVSNVLESIAAGSIAVKSQEAADLMASFTFNQSENETDQKSYEKAENENEKDEQKKEELKKIEVEKAND